MRWFPCRIKKSENPALAGVQCSFLLLVCHFSSQEKARGGLPLQGGGVASHSAGAGPRERGRSGKLAVSGRGPSGVLLASVAG
jgi:hypothetical protein